MRRACSGVETTRTGRVQNHGQPQDMSGPCLRRRTCRSRNAIFCSFLFSPRYSRSAAISFWHYYLVTGTTLIILNWWYFQVFYYVHKLYVLYWLLTILHGPIFWRFFLVPGLVYVAEVITRSHTIRLVTRRGLTRVKSFQVLPSKVSYFAIKGYHVLLSIEARWPTW